MELQAHNSRQRTDFPALEGNYEVRLNLRILLMCRINIACAFELNTKAAVRKPADLQGIDTPGRRLRNSPLLSPHGTGNKRLKLMPAANRTILAQTGAIVVHEGIPEGKADIFEFFAERGTENNRLREKLKEAEKNEQIARETAESFKSELQTLQVGSHHWFHKLVVTVPECHNELLETFH